MNTAVARYLLTVLLLVTVTALSSAGGSDPGAAGAVRFGKLTVESKRLEGTIGGPWEFSAGVTVTGPDIILTCDALKAWPGTKGGRDFDRAEATGNITVRGRYTARDGAEWAILGTAASGTYDGKAGRGVLRGGVKFRGTNQTTNAVLSVAADKLTYEVKTQRFEFERGGQPVLVEWQEPEPAAASKQEGGQ